MVTKRDIFKATKTNDRTGGVPLVLKGGTKAVCSPICNLNVVLWNKSPPDPQITTDVRTSGLHKYLPIP